jgi:hypothetical protein
MDIRTQGRIGFAQLAPYPFQRSFHAETRIGTHYQEIHKIGEARSMLVAPSGDAPVDVHAGRDIAENATHDHGEPEHQAAQGNDERDGDECHSRERDRHRRACHKEIGNSPRIEDSGEHQAAPQRLHFPRILVGDHVVLGGVIEYPEWP